MAFSVKSAVSSRVVASKARPAVRVEAFNGEKAMLSVASFTAAVMLAAPADAGVILVQPSLKNAFRDNGPGFVRSENGIQTVAAPKVSAGTAVSETEGSGGFELDPRVIALPASVGFVAFLALVGSKLDGEFEAFMTKGMLKNNGDGYGVGYEEEIKSTWGGIYGTPSRTVKTKKGPFGF